MKLPLIRTINRQDLVGKGDVPAWMDSFIQTLNGFINPITSALQGRLTFADNSLGKEVSVGLTHATKLVINPLTPSGLRVRGVCLVDPNSQIVTGFGWSREANNQIGITVNFLAGAGTVSTCLLQIQYG